MGRHNVQSFAVPAVYVSKGGAAYPNGFLQHRCEHRLELALRSTDDLEHLRSRGLLLKRFCQLTCSLLFSLEQPNVLNGDHGLIGKGRDQFNFALGKGIDAAAR